MQYRLIGGNFTVFEFLHRCKHVCCQTNIFQIAELIWTNQTCSKYSNIYRVIYPHKSILQPNYILICLPYFGASFFPHRQELIQQDLPVRQRLHLTVQLADVDWRLKQGCGDSIQLPEVDFWNLIFLFCFFLFFSKRCFDVLWCFLVCYVDVVNYVPLFIPDGWCWKIMVHPFCWPCFCFMPFGYCHHLGNLLGLGLSF